MQKTPTTYQIAARHIAAYVRPLEQGAFGTPFELRDQDGRLLRSVEDHLAGKPMILVFLNEASPALLKALAEIEGKIEGNAAVIAISAADDFDQNRALARQTGFPWPIVGDSTGGVFASFGLHKGNCADWRIVVMTRLSQVRGWIDAPADINQTMETIMEYLRLSSATEEARWETPHAPVLVIPNVFSRDECARLIKSFETEQPFLVRPQRPGEFEGDFKIPIYEHNRQDRVDQIIKDPATLAFLDERIFAKVVPMIKKVFSFDVKNREDVHIARYVGARGGNHMGHRDNQSPHTAHRRFAFSMNLNDEFEGGDVVFNEFSPRGYRTEPGSVLIFSSSLLHEVMETTKGTRYSLIMHFFAQ